MKILVAEDEIILRRTLERTLQGWGYEPTAVADGTEALAVLRAPDGPRLAVLDWMMPDRTGLEVARAMRRLGVNRYVYTLLLTAKNEPEDLVAGLDAGADDFLAKPVILQELRARLNAGRRIVELHTQLIDTRDELQQMALRDALTGAFNRGAILELLDCELIRSQREQQPVGLLLVDVDHFKKVNDRYGHPAGDAVLREIVLRMRAFVRATDALGRYGGEEFLLVLPGCDSPTTRLIAERLRHQVAALPIEYEGLSIPVTLSLGTAVSTPPFLPLDAHSLLFVADAALYRAKEEGRNRVAPATAPVASHPVRCLPFAEAAARET